MAFHLGFPLEGPMPKKDYGWSRTRKALQRIKIGDYVGGFERKEAALGLA